MTNSPDSLQQPPAPTQEQDKSGKLGQVYQLLNRGGQVMVMAAPFLKDTEKDVHVSLTSLQHTTEEAESIEQALRALGVYTTKQDRSVSVDGVFPASQVRALAEVFVAFSNLLETADSTYRKYYTDAKDSREQE